MKIALFIFYNIRKSIKSQGDGLFMNKYSFILNKYYLTSFSGAKVHIFLLTSPEITTKYTKKANFILFYLQFALPLHRFIYINK